MAKKIVGKTRGKNDEAARNTAMYRDQFGFPNEMSIAHGTKIRGRARWASGKFKNFEGHWSETDQFFLVKTPDGETVPMRGGKHIQLEILEYKLGN